MTAARLTQEVAEAISLVKPGVRVSHAVVEGLDQVVPVSQVSQVVVEPLSEIHPTTQLSQIVVEVLSSNVESATGLYRKRWGGVFGVEPVASYSGVW